MDQPQFRHDHRRTDLHTLYWRAGVYSIAEYLGLRYNQAVRVVAADIFVVVSVFAMGVAMWALAITLQTFLGWLHLAWHISLRHCSGFLYGVAGGLGAVAITDSIQVCIMFVSGLIIVAIGIGDAGGAERFISELTAENPTHLQRLPACRSRELSLAWRHSGTWLRAIAGILDRQPSNLAAHAGCENPVGCRRGHDIRCVRKKPCCHCSLSFQVCSRW